MDEYNICLNEHSIIKNLQEKNSDYLKFSEKFPNRWITLLGHSSGYDDIVNFCGQKNNPSTLHIITMGQEQQFITYCVIQNQRLVLSNSQHPYIVPIAMLHSEQSIKSSKKFTILKLNLT